MEGEGVTSQACCSLNEDEIIFRKPRKPRKDNDNGQNDHLRCLDCNYVYSSLSKLNRHLREVHLAVKQHQCMGCGKFYRRKEHRDRHIEAIHLAGNESLESYLAKSKTPWVPPLKKTRLAKNKRLNEVRELLKKRHRSKQPETSFSEFKIQIENSKLMAEAKIAPEIEILSEGSSKSIQLPIFSGEGKSQVLTDTSSTAVDSPEVISPSLSQKSINLNAQEPQNSQVLPVISSPVPPQPSRNFVCGPEHTWPLYPFYSMNRSFYPKPVDSSSGYLYPPGYPMANRNPHCHFAPNPWFSAARQPPRCFPAFSPLPQAQIAGPRLGISAMGFQQPNFSLWHNFNANMRHQHVQPYML